MAIQNKFRSGLVLRYTIIAFVFVGLFSCSEEGATSKNEHSSRYMTKGELMFIERCAVCHGEKGDANIAGAADLTKTTLNDSEMKEVVEFGQNGMPAFGLIFENTSDMDSLIVYINTLK